MHFEPETGKTERAPEEPEDSTSAKRKRQFPPPPANMYTAQANVFTAVVPEAPLSMKTAAGGVATCRMVHSDVYPSLRPIYEALREERDRLLKQYGNFDDIPEDQVTDTFKTMFRIGKKYSELDEPHPSATQAAADHDEPDFFESQSQGAGGGGEATFDTEDKDPQLNQELFKK